MFILTPIAINSFLTSKRVHGCSLIVIVISLAVPWDSSSFSSDCSVRISKRYKEGEEIVTSISLSTCETNFFVQEHYFVNPNSETVRKLVPKMVSKFHDDPTVNESEIIILLGQIWIYAGKEKTHCEGYFIHHKHCLENPNGGCVRK